jgi:hypothetical protein
MIATIRRHPIPFVLAAIHSALVLFVALLVWTSDDGETGMLWYVFVVLDWPVSSMYYRIAGETNVMIGVLLLGGRWWAVIGAVVQVFVSVYRANHR